MKPISILFFTIVIGLSHKALAGGGGGGGVLLASFSNESSLAIYSFGNNETEEFVALAKFENGSWAIENRVLRISDLKEHPYFEKAVLQSRSTQDWVSVSKPSHE